jgi:four helix bundle protein
MNLNENQAPHVFDLEERLLDFASRIVRLAGKLPSTPPGRHVAGQILRSGTAPMAHHGEAQGAESRSDFIHKMSLAYKELRETTRWLKLCRRVPLLRSPDKIDPLLQENEELVRIFKASLKTAEAKVKDKTYR